MKWSSGAEDMVSWWLLNFPKYDVAWRDRYILSKIEGREQGCGIENGMCAECGVPAVEFHGVVNISLPSARADSRRFCCGAAPSGPPPA